MNLATREKLGVKGDEALARVDGQHLKYLRYHRQLHAIDSMHAIP
jgi:hypothetical protein